MVKAEQIAGTQDSAGSGSHAAPGKRRRRGWIWASLAMLVIVVSLLAGVIAVVVGRRTPTSRTDFPDYTELAAQFPGSKTLRYPTEEELRQFPTLWPMVGPEENALADYLKAIGSFSSLPPPAGSFQSSSQYDGDAAALGRWIEANQPALDVLSQAVRHDYFGLPVLVSTAEGMPVPDVHFLSNMRQLARLCADAGFHAELEGRPRDAVEWYMTCLRTGRHMRRGVMIQNLVSIAMTAVGSVPLNRLIANASLSDDALKAVISFCDDEPPIAAEIAFVLDAEEEWFNAHPISLRIAAEILSGQRRAIRRARKDFALALSELTRQEDARQMLADTSSTSGTQPGLWRWRSEIARRQARMEALKTRAAIALYANRHGKLPARLDDLVPGILTEVPGDPFTDLPFVYEQEEEAWELRSSGPDREISGDQKPTHDQLRGNFWHGTVYSHWPGSESSTVGDDYIFVSDLDSNVDRARRRYPKADARWNKLHPEFGAASRRRPGPGQLRRPGGGASGQEPDVPSQSGGVPTTSHADP